MPMTLRFQSALFGVGALLALIGLAVGLMASGQLEQAADFSDALSAGVTSSFFALFSGVLIGIGAALVAAGAMLFARQRTARIAAALLLCFASLVLSAGVLGSPGGFGFALLLAFFSAIVFSGAMLAAAVAFSLSGMVNSRPG